MSVKKILHISASPNTQSQSRKVAQLAIEKLRKKHPQAELITRDLDRNPLPHLSGAMVGASFTPADQRTGEQKRLLENSDRLVQELLSAEIIVISTPMWNFGVPSSLKAWIDHVVRPGLTFNYGPEGLKGLIPADRRVIVATASGSIYSDGPMAAMDHLVPHLKSVFGFMGVTDVTVFRAEGSSVGAEKAAEIFKNTEALILASL